MVERADLGVEDLDELDQGEQPREQCRLPIGPHAPRKGFRGAARKAFADAYFEYGRLYTASYEGFVPVPAAAPKDGDDKDGEKKDGDKKDGDEKK